MSAKPITATVLAPDGTQHGTVDLVPTNALWRARKERPRLHLRGDVRELEPLGESWALRLREGEPPPRNRRGAA